MQLQMYFFVRPFRLLIFCIAFILITSVSFAQKDSNIQNKESSPRLSKEGEPLDLLVKGRYSLLFNEKNKLFYIGKNDSLLVISQQHMQRALPIIFGKDFIEAYYTKTNIKPQYSARYLKNLTLYANQSQGAESEIFEERLEQFKTSVHIGPYIGYALNRTAFDITAGFVKGKLTYRTTDFYSSNSIPIGFRVDLNLSKRIGIDLGVYMNQTKAENINIDSTGLHAIPFPSSVLVPEKYDTDLKTTGFSYRTLHLDLAMNVVLTNDEQSRFKPYALIGPTLAFMKKNEIKQSAGYRETPQDNMTYFSRWSKMDDRQYLVGFNVGLGADYAISERITLNAAAKFIGGIYPKIRHRSFITKTQNDTPAPNEQFGTFNSSFQSVYDQYLRMFSVGVSATYKL